jgi:uncharacterized protein DUF4382
MNRTPLAPVLAGALLCALAGCSTRTDVSATGNTPAKYSHVWITTQEVWFNTSAIAGPDDGGWIKFTLSTPGTVDLVADSGGSLGSIVTDLKLEPGTYSQIRLIPLDSSAALATSAQTLGALYNAEADYVDSAGTTHQLPLELLNPDKGIGIQGTLKVPVGDIGAALAASSAAGTTNTTGTTDFAGTPTTTPTVPTIPTTPTTPTNPTTPTTTTTTSFAVNQDGTHDLMPFAYAYGSSSATSTTPGCAAPASCGAGILLSSHAVAYDLSQVGAITGTLTLTGLTSISGASGLPAIQASAQVLSADGTRHVVVSSTPVHSDGTFTLYPLAANSSNAVDYDVVIHGPGIATIIIKAVQVTLAGSPSSTTTDTSTTTGTTGTPSLNSVSIGTLIPRAATSYTANFVNSPAALPAGAQVSFYQTLDAAGEVPYVIETSPIDPFNQNLADDQGLSEGTIDSGTWASSASSITVVSAAPKEKTGTYIVAASAPSFSDGALTTTVSEPAATTGTTTPPAVSIAPVATLALAAGNSPGTISASVSPAVPQKYQHGELLVSHEGALIAAVPLDAALGSSGGATITVSGVPSGTAPALYYLSVRVWDSSGNVQRQSYPTPIDLRGAATGSAQLTIN